MREPRVMRSLLCAIVIACSGLSGLALTYKPVMFGMASFYSHADHNRKTSSGRRFNEHELTAASPSLPFGTIVCVTYLKTGKSVLVEITDRGPFHRRGRIIDLSEEAAGVIGLKSAGVGRVKLEIIQQ
jgi:rare lipoprotein A